MNTKELLYYNGFGGFSKDQNEYVIQTNEDFTPLPWSHMLANENFGTLITANGGGYVWSGNSRENKLTAWSNDMVEDPPSEKLWLEEDGKQQENHLLSEQRELRFLLPYESLKNFEVVFGFGYASFAKEEDNLKTQVCIFVPRRQKKKIYQITLSNQDTQTREITFCYQMIPVLGVAREYTKKHIAISIKENGAIFQNFFREDYAEEKVFLVASEAIQDWNENDKIITMKIPLVLKPQEIKKVIIELGVLSENESMEISQNSEQLLEEVKCYWHEMTGKIQVKTPVESMNILLNGWLLYQTMTSRLWGRTSFYQAGGAFRIS